ncbi:ABC transporter ATP-binding protein [Halobaculum sp. MBLA0143]|uniref:ABC transporter ATP-binding protein n=1 Tax=Halobaculum sp. MBLA0143 TaxID=3079933 RepID=UPI0035241AE9
MTDDYRRGAERTRHRESPRNAEQTDDRATTDGGQARRRSETGVPLELTDVTKTYGDSATAVEDLSLSLRDGELLVLVGPSGCGKSTTLRMIAGLEEPTSGDVRIDGQSVLGLEPEARNTAMVFQNYALYPHMTARQNIGFGLRMTTNLSDEEIAAEVESVADTLDVTELLDDTPDSMSGGQQQRVALGRAIVRDPSVFLLDEPLSNLDATLRARMRTEIQQLQRDLGVTTVYVTHDQTEAMTMGDRVAVLLDGEIQQVAPPMDCYHEPTNLFVAQFVGEPSMNTLSMRAERDGFAGPVDYPAVEPLVDAADGFDRVTVGARPEDVVVTETGDTRTTLPATVDVTEPVGERSFVHATLDGGPSVTAAVDGGADVRERDRIGLRLPPDRLHLFDTDSGEAIHHPDRESAVEFDLA